MGFDLGNFLFGSDPEKYDNNTKQAQDARTFGVGGVNHNYDVQGSQAQGSQLNTGNYNQDRGQQLGLAGALTRAAQGQGPSAAAMAGQQARDASLSNAAALQAGRRGRSAAQGAMIGSNAASQGVQQANATQAQGQANEMATARGQLGGVLSGLAGQDIGVAGQNAQLSQNNNQFNAGMNQQANLANQQTQYGIGSQELGARQHQGDMSFSNLNPGSQGLISPTTAAEAAGVAAKAAFAKGGLVTHPTKALIGEAGPEMVVPLGPGHDKMRDAARAILKLTPDHRKEPHMADGGLVLGIGQREAPNWNQSAQAGLALGNALIGGVSNYLSDSDDLKKTTEKATQQATAKGNTSGLTGMYQRIKQMTADPNSPLYKQDPDQMLSQMRLAGVDPSQYSSTPIPGKGY